MPGLSPLTLQPQLLGVLQSEAEDEHVSGHSLQVVLQHIELEGWGQGRPSLPPSWSPAPHARSGPRRAQPAALLLLLLLRGP